MSIQLFLLRLKCSKYGSNKAIKKLVAYRNSTNETNSAETLVLLEDIIFQIRRDLGIKKRGMNKGDILSIFVNDVDEIIKKGPEK